MRRPVAAVPPAGAADASRAISMSFGYVHSIDARLARIWRPFQPLSYRPSSSAPGAMPRTMRTTSSPLRLRPSSRSVIDGMLSSVIRESAPPPTPASRPPYNGSTDLRAVPRRLQGSVAGSGRGRYSPAVHHGQRLSVGPHGCLRRVVRAGGARNKHIAVARRIEPRSTPPEEIDMSRLLAVVLSATLAASGVLGAIPAEAQQKFITIGTGGVTGVYYAVGGAICRLVNKDRKDHGIRCSVESTGGSVYNVNTLRTGELDLGMAQSDVQFNATKGVGG